MPQVIFAPGAIRDLQRIRDFLQQKNPIAAKRAAATIIQSVQLLGLQPHSGRLVEDMSDAYREWVIEFGDSGYIARYRLDDETIVVLAVRHQREAGFI
jgi:plasmid stabilization system protein ParE